MVDTAPKSRVQHAGVLTRAQLRELANAAEAGIAIRALAPSRLQRAQTAVQLIERLLASSEHGGRA